MISGLYSITEWWNFNGQLKVYLKVYYSVKHFRLLHTQTNDLNLHIVWNTFFVTIIINAESFASGLCWRQLIVKPSFCPIVQCLYFFFSVLFRQSIKYFDLSNWLLIPCVSWKHSCISDPLIVWYTTCFLGLANQFACCNVTYLRVEDLCFNNRPAFIMELVMSCHWVLSFFRIQQNLIFLLKLSEMWIKLSL